MVRETKAYGKQWSGSNQAGITLLEMLVVFALVSLISTLLLQFTGFLTSGFERTASMEREAFRSRLFQRWYQNSTAGIVASLDAEAGFHGAKESMTGYTLFPVFGPSGVPTRFSWSLQEEDDMVGIWYQEADAPPVKMYQWPADKVEFSYRPLNGTWAEKWPLPGVRPGVSPFRILLKIQTDVDEYQMLSAVQVRRTGIYDYRDLL